MLYTYNFKHHLSGQIVVECMYLTRVGSIPRSVDKVVQANETFLFLLVNIGLIYYYRLPLFVQSYVLVHIKVVNYTFV